MCAIFDGDGSKQLIRAGSNVLRQAMLGELQMSGGCDDARSMEFVGKSSNKSHLLFNLCLA